MKYSLLCFVVLLLSSVTANASQTSHDDILKPIYSLFDGMREGDGDKVRAVFSPHAVFYRAHAELRTSGSPETFAQAVENKGDQVWDEKIWDIRIHVDDKLASVWTQFAFYLDDTLTHCGVNSFQLYKYDDGWKIIFLADTYRTDDCAVPDLN